MSGQSKEADLTRRQGAGGPSVPPTTPANRKKSRVSWFGGVEAKNLVGVALKDGQGKKLGVNCKLVGSVAKILPLVVSCCKVGGRWKNVIFNQKKNHHNKIISVSVLWKLSYITTEEAFTRKA